MSIFKLALLRLYELKSRSRDAPHFAKKLSSTCIVQHMHRLKNYNKFWLRAMLLSAHDNAAAQDNDWNNLAS